MEPDVKEILLKPGLILDLHGQRLVQNGVSISLSQIQFRILQYLVQHLERPVRAEDIIRYAWGTEHTGSKSELYVYISRLRTRIGDNARLPRLLIGIRGYGYLLRCDRKHESP